MKKPLTLILAFFALFAANLSFSQTMMSDTSTNIYSSIYTMNESNSIEDQLSVGYAFKGDTIFSPFYITNPTDKKVVFNNPPTWLLGETSFTLIGIDFPLTLEAKDPNSIVQDSAFGTILFIPYSDTTIAIVGKGQMVSDPVESFVNPETNDKIDYYYSTEINLYGLCYGDSYKNLGSSTSTINKDLTDSCVYEVPDFAGEYEATFIEESTINEVTLTNLVVNQSVETGTLFFSSNEVVVDYSFTSYPGFYFTGSYILSIDLNYMLAEGYTCPYDSVLPVKSFEGNGGEATLSGNFYDQLLLSRLARTTVDGTPVSGAIVYLIDKTSGFVVGETITDLDGFFNFTGLKNGDYSITIKYNSYVVDSKTSSIKIENGVSDNTIMAKAEGGLIYFRGTVVSGLFASKNSQGNVQILPNPVMDILNISISNGNEIETLTISDAHGRVINQLSNVSEVNTSDFAAGYYYLTIESKNTVYNTKFVKL